MTDSENRKGIRLAHRLGLSLEKQEGHDLAGPCIACQSSDAFRLHMDSGVAQCYSCHGKWSPFQLAEAVAGDRNEVTSALADAGIFERRGIESPPSHLVDPIVCVAQKKHVTVDALRAFGGKSVRYGVRFPCYGPDARQCTTFTIPTNGGKGLFAKGNPAGLFFPHTDDQVRLPHAGETWCLVEGVKDAAALFGLGYLAAGLNTSRLAAKVARLFRDIDVILVPDRDRAGESGAEHTSRVLRGFARSVRICTLPAESKESQGSDVRDILKLKAGEELLRQAISDATPPLAWQSGVPLAESVTATVTLNLAEGDPLTLRVLPASKGKQRVVIAARSGVEHRDSFNIESSASRDRFIRKLAAKLSLEFDFLAPIIEPQLPKLALDADMSAVPEESGHPSQATTAVNLALDWELWHTPEGEAYATIPIQGHYETWPVRSQKLRQYLAMRFFENEKAAIGSESCSAALNLIEAHALFQGPENAIHVRVAQVEDSIYLDLCNHKWQVVEISSNGWEILDEAPVRFRRSHSMMPLPVPIRGGSVGLLRNFVNVDDESWQLLVAWLVAALRPVGPYPVLALFAEQGSGKSTIGRILRALIDPNSAPLRAEPRECRDLMIMANNSWCLAFDNLSHVHPWLSDALCRISTGGGFATRALYTDHDEIVFDSQQPILLTSIEEVASRSDLLDRCLTVQLPVIETDLRRPEAEILAAFELVRPEIIGALLDAVSMAIRRLPMTRLPNLPRMADFALWVTAAESALGWDAGSFMRTYTRNQESANEVALEASPIARPLLEFLDRHGRWTGTAADLLSALESSTQQKITGQKSWPKNPRSLSGQLNRLTSNLRSVGWDVTNHRVSNQRLISIERSDAIASSGRVASRFDEGPHVQSDADRCETCLHDVNDDSDANAG